VLYGTASGAVTPGANSNVTIQLQPSGTVTGLVVRPDGTTPAYGATVLLQLGSGAGSVSLQSGSDGRFTATGVPLGAFTVRIDDPLTGGIGLVGGLTVAANGDTVDAGRIVLDDTPITVLSVDPADGATGVAINKAIVVTLSDPLQSTAGISVLNGTSPVALTATLSPDAKSVTLTGTLPDSVELTVVAGTGLTDIFGRHAAQTFSSRFRTVDQSAPVVSTIVPVSGAIQILSDAKVVVSFNEPLGATTNLATLITVTAPSNSAVAGSAALTAANVVTFTPASPLASDGLYSVVVNGAVDLSGNTQTAPFASQFATTDTAPPAITIAYPRNAWISDARPNVSFVITDATSGIATGTATMTIDNVAVTPAVSTGAISYTPGTALTDGTHNVAVSIADRAGNRASLPASFGVDTVPPAAPLLTGITGGQVLIGTVTIGATAADSGSGIGSIQLLMDGGVIATLTAPSFSVAYNTNSLSEGPHTFSAKAIDTAGNIGALSAAVNAVVDNRPLTVSINAPQANQRFRDSVKVQASISEPAIRVDFTLGAQTQSDTAAPYEATFDLAAVAEGTRTITVQGIGTAGDVATVTRDIVVDRTPPAAPDASRINAEPPSGGRSLVFGRAGAVEGNSSVEVKNTRTGVVVTIAAAADGSFSLFIDGNVDDLLSITATDIVGNRSAATTLSIRQTPSLPPASGATTLRFEGVLVDKVGTTVNSITPDGKNDAVFTMSIAIGDGVTRQLSYIDLTGNGGTRSTRSGNTVLGAATDPGGALLNAPNGTLTLPVIAGTTLTLFAADEGFLADDAVYTVTAVFGDGSRFVATAKVEARTDHDRVPHSVKITPNPGTVVVGASPGTTTMTLSDIRDIHGALVPDGTKIALSAANAATRNGLGADIASVGGNLVDGTLSPNNAGFKIYSVTGGQVTATYSSGSVTPAAFSGAVAVVTALAADDSGNVIGNESIGAAVINLHASSDQA
ncbi:MAG: LamG domain protein jellyroll fold domain protein, partial [Acidobacteria bacterium]|nr:LamG domain protein jellyroll fold domain protein [Acidobacteriota bacterium]